MFKQIPFLFKKGYRGVFMLFVAMTVFTVSCACKRPVDKIKDEQVVILSDTTKNYQLRYSLEEPDLSFSLKNELLEISGLSMDISEKFFWAVQDEDGIIYKVSKEDGQILEKIDFYKDGDYEGIELVGNDVYVLKNSGTIYKVSNIGEPDQKMEKFNTALGKENDVEGLGYDSKSNCLLLACKGSPGIDSDEVKLEKAIYAFSLDTMGLQIPPVFVISFEQVHQFVGTSPALKHFEKLSEYFQPGETNFTFSPSAINVHPLTGEIYILSASKKILLILSPDGKILHMEKLKKKVHSQPEGLCFDKDGTMYISNEGKDGKAKIHRFVMNTEEN